VRNQPYIALLVGNVTKEEFEKINGDNGDLENLANQIGGFIQYLEKKRKNKQFALH